MPSIHLVAMPHVQTLDDVSVCAYTQQIVRFCRMMKDTLDVHLYSGDLNDAPVASHTACYTGAEQEEWLGGKEIMAASFDAASPGFRAMNLRAAVAISERAEEHDVVFLSAGLAQERIASVLAVTRPDLIVAEYAIGYLGCFAPYRSYVSHAWRHHTAGLYGPYEGRWTDEVIPYFFDPDEWPETQDEVRREGLLFIGRVMRHKGPQIAAEIAKATGRTLTVVGPGVAAHEEGRIVATDGTVIEAPGLRYGGAVGHSERIRLMSTSAAVLVPSLYYEPFGAVAVEAQLAGAPAIAPDWGAFTETVPDGWRFRNLREAVAAVERTEMAAHSAAERRQAALRKYGFHAVRPQYERWIDRLGDLWGAGWYAP